jgi:hypothetical protein
VSGKTVVVGAPFDNDDGNDSGSAYMFGLSQSGNWVQKAKLTADDGFNGTEFGWSVAIAGDVVVVGAQYDDYGSNQDVGSVYVF